MTEWQDRAKELVNAHWDGYLYIALKLASVYREADSDPLEEIGFHYKSSGIHFYKHAIEDIKAGIIKIDEI